MDTAGIANFQKLAATSTKTNFLAPSTNDNIQITKISILINFIKDLRMP